MDIKTTVIQLIDFIITETTANALGISATHFFHPTEKRFDPQKAAFDDIGDYLVFVAWAGKIYKNQEWIDFANNQISLWDKYFGQKDGWYVSEIDLRKSIRANRFNLTISPYNHQDAVLGFYELWLLTKDKKYYQQLVSLLAAYKKVWKKNNHIIPNVVFKLGQKALPWSSANPAVAGLVAEHAFLMHQNKFAKELIDPWLKTTLWKKHGLLTQGINTYVRNISPYHTAKVMKEASNVVYAMNAFPEHYHQDLNYFAEKLLALQSTNNGFFSGVSVDNDTITSKIDKTQNFTCIDLLIALASNGKSKHQSKLLSAATKCADFWLSLKDPETNLIPDYATVKGEPLYTIAKLDQSADLYSSLLRLYSLTGEKRLLHEAEIGGQAMSNAFGRSSWWYRIVNTKTGKPATDKQVPAGDRPASINMTKYVGGALRFYLSLEEIRRGKSMQKNTLLACLSRDR